MSIFQKFVLRSLKENKVRTLVTIIGIVLSVSMLTAVTTGVSSFQDFMLRVVEQEYGSWHVYFVKLQKEGLEQIKVDEEVESFGIINNVGYAKLENPLREDCSYLYVGAYEENFLPLTGEQIIEGREPKNSNEIIIPNLLLENEELGYKVGDTITLSLGERKSSEGETLWQSNYYMEEGEESFSEIGEKKYTIVGVYQGGHIDSAYLPGYNVLTKADDKISSETMDMFLTVKHPKKAESFMENWGFKLVKEENSLLQTSHINNDYLLYSGNPNDPATLAFIYGMIAILMGVIMLGSVSLIYNTFSISINERKKQFGLLSSVGATRKQLRRSVLFEAFVLSIIGIPLGVFAGIGGMALTFQLLSGTFKRFLDVNGPDAITIQLSASLFAVLLAIVVGFVTVLLSAWIPARKALKVPTIEVLRQSDDIKIKAKKIKTSKLTQKIFGLEGVLAIKNFKRNKKKYQATVFSLFISIVLFISASSFCDYLAKSLENTITYYDCDLQYNTMKNNAANDIYPELAKMVGVTKSAYYETVDYVELVVTGEVLTEDYLKYAHNILDRETVKNEEFVVWATVVTMEDEAYKAYLKEQGLDSSVYMNKEKPTAVVVNKTEAYASSIEKFVTYSSFLKGEMGVQALKYNPDKLEKKIGGEFTFDDIRSVDENGKLQYKVWKDSEEEQEPVYVKPEELFDIKEMRLGKMVQEAPFGAESLVETGTLLIYPKSFQEMLTDDEVVSTLMVFCAKDPDLTYREMTKVLKKYRDDNGDLYNIYDEIQINKGLMTIIRVFSFGFIVLISLIATANVFNTISTNVMLRRHEFATLRSVGMTQKGFYKMMNIECLRYGLLGIGFGIPVAIGITYLIFIVVSEEIVMDFYVPWYSILIAVGSVFIVVFATMLYSMNKIKKDNVVETLRNDVA